ncbi:MAG: imidazolonepropionase [Alphaproteobacteria bacterium]
MWDRMWTNVNLATMADNAGHGGYGAISDGAIAVADGRIAWIGTMADLPGTPASLARQVQDAGGLWMTPGLIDCHNHLAFGGSRAREFEMRLEGATYEEISRAGGGILSTVKATREWSEERLLAAALSRARAQLAEGATTLEIKSGYGLDLDSELKQLRVAREVGRQLPITVTTTFLGAHSIPPEYKDRSDDYVDLVVNTMLPAVVRDGLADAVDAFCEGIAFSVAQTERVFAAAEKHGLPVKLHAEQLSDLGGAALAARHGALSADHLEYVSQASVEAMARAGTVAVMLPGAFYFLREKQLPPIQAFRDAGVAMAVATDANPGTSPTPSLLLMMSMACTLFRMTPVEALAGTTRVAAQALGMAAERGTLEVGKAADMALWRIDEPAELSYRFGADPLVTVISGGAVMDAASLARF